MVRCLLRRSRKRRCDEAYDLIDEHHIDIETSLDAELRVIGDDMHRAAQLALNACVNKAPGAADDAYSLFSEHYRALEFRAEEIRGPR